MIVSSSFGRLPLFGIGIRTFHSHRNAASIRQVSAELGSLEASRYLPSLRAYVTSKNVSALHGSSIYKTTTLLRLNSATKLTSRMVYIERGQVFAEKPKVPAGDGSSDR